MELTIAEFVEGIAVFFPHNFGNMTHTPRIGNVFGILVQIGKICQAIQ